jgi:hypothetical protein
MLSTNRLTRGIVALAFATVVGCAGLFQLGPRPAQLAGVWLDSSTTTPTDTFSRVLDQGGDDRSFHVRVIRNASGRAVLDTQSTRNGRWWVSGDLSDTVGRRLCVTPRPGRNPGTCITFRLDTLVMASGNGYRRLTLWLPDDEGRRGAHVLLEQGR